ncbi:hypothetical protein BDN72DRAFT_736461, partial [Pluteus cervinus]
GRYRELCSWRKEFKKEWRKLEKREITLPVNDAYRPDPAKWICTCPAFVTSRFLICKHLVQLVHRPPPIFFLEVKRHRTLPFWRHRSLKLIDDTGGECSMGEMGGDVDDEGPESDGYEDDEEFDEIESNEGGQTFEETWQANIDLITEFVAGLRFQAPFRDQRMLNALEREGAGFFRLAKACLEKEKRLRSQRGGEPPSTWEKSTISALFYRARPTNSHIQS